MSDRPGVLVRAVARGGKVAVVQFLESGEWKVGEEKVGRQLGVDWWAIGEGFTWDSVLTGRHAPAALVGMRNVKHAHDAGVPARKGIDH